MNRSELNRYIELLLVFILGFSIPAWKPGIYVASSAILLYSLVRLMTDRDYRTALLSGWIGPAAIGLYLFGLATTWIHPGLLEDTLLFARKGMFLLIIAPLMLAFADQTNRRFALAGLFAGFWGASLLAFASIEWPWDGTRIYGTWTVDVWGVIVGMIVSFLTPFVFERQSTGQRVFFAINLMLAIVMLILSGARGPWIGSLAGMGLYLLVMQRKALLGLIVICAVLYWPAKQLMPLPFAALQSYASSITNLDSSSTNWIRINMWRLTLAHNQEKIANAPMTFFFGSGPDNHYREIRSFFDRTDVLTQQQRDVLTEHDYPGNDMHNMYLDSTAKMGILWTILTLGYLLALGLGSIRSRMPGNQTAVAGLLVLGNFLVVGAFYDILAHFATFFLVFFMTLAIQSGRRPIVTGG